MSIEQWGYVVAIVGTVSILWPMLSLYADYEKAKRSRDIYRQSYLLAAEEIKELKAAYSDLLAKYDHLDGML